MQFKYMYQQQPSQVCFGKSCSTYSKKVGAPSLQNWRFNTEHQKIDFRLGGWFSWDIFHFIRGAVFRSTWCSAKVDFTKSQLYHGIFRLGFFLNEFCWTTIFQNNPGDCFCKNLNYFWYGAPSLQNWRFNTEHQKIDFRLGGWFSWDIFHFIRGAVFRSTWCSAKVDFTKSQLYHGIFRLGFFLNEFCWTTIFQNNPGDCFCKNLNYFWYACFSWFMVSYVLDVSHGFLWTMVFL